MNISPDTLFHLTRHLRNMNSAISVTEAIDQAVRIWLTAATNAPSGGYRWKALFLPEGTRLRVWSHPEHPEACVVGNYLLCKGQPVSPNQYVQSWGAHRNAWELISVLLPGEKYWKLAKLLRQPPSSPAPMKSDPIVSALPQRSQHRWGERRAWNVGGRRETDSMPEPVFLDH